MKYEIKKTNDGWALYIIYSEKRSAIIEFSTAYELANYLEEYHDK